VVDFREEQAKARYDQSFMIATAEKRAMAGEGELSNEEQDPRTRRRCAWFCKWGRRRATLAAPRLGTVVRRGFGYNAARSESLGRPMEEAAGGFEEVGHGEGKSKSL